MYELAENLDVQGFTVLYELPEEPKLRVLRRFTPALELRLMYEVA